MRPRLHRGTEILQPLRAIGHRRAAPRLEALARRCDCRIDISRRSTGYTSNGFLGRRGDHVDRVAARWLVPRATVVVLLVESHEPSILRYAQNPLSALGYRLSGSKLPLQA